MRSILCAVLFSVFVIGVVEYGYRYTGGLPSVTPGKTRLELQWKIQQARSAKVVYVVGDSRVDWGFADRLFTKYVKQLSGENVYAANAGLPSASTREIIKYILDHHPGDPGILVINFTPGSFCHFVNSPGESHVNIKRQDFLDHRITNVLAEWLYTYGRSPAFLSKHLEQYRREGYKKRFGWYSRTVFRDGFINTEASYNDGSSVIRDLGFYTLLFQDIRENPARYKKRRNGTVKVIREAQKAGWNVILTRFPIGDGMRDLEENHLSDYLLPEQIAAELSVPFFDYDSDPRTAELPTGESHLKPDSARTLSIILADDLLPILANEDSRKPFSENTLLAENDVSNMPDSELKRD